MNSEDFFKDANFTKKWKGKSGDNETEDDYEEVIKNKKLKVPTSYINEEGEEDDI